MELRIEGIFGIVKVLPMSMKALGIHNSDCAPVPLTTRMRPRFAITIMLITLVFLLTLMCSPGFWRRKPVDRAAVAWLQDRTPEKEQAIRFEQKRARRRQYVVCGLAVLNVIGIIVYTGLQEKKRAANKCAAAPASAGGQ
ncbi:MAG TPA: hypothetical protein VFW05_09905 [Verrucomicrobiae bacterium]|nr:hypothetical protein [Verrucomicrobiae bacterium]